MADNGKQVNVYQCLLRCCVETFDDFRPYTDHLVSVHEFARGEASCLNSQIVHHIDAEKYHVTAYEIFRSPGAKSPIGRLVITAPRSEEEALLWKNWDKEEVEYGTGPDPNE